MESVLWRENMPVGYGVKKCVGKKGVGALHLCSPKTAVVRCVRTRHQHVTLFYRQTTTATLALELTTHLIYIASLLA